MVQMEDKQHLVCGTRNSLAMDL